MRSAPLTEGETAAVKTLNKPHHSTAPVSTARDPKRVNEEPGRYLESCIAYKEGADEPPQVSIVDRKFLPYLDTRNGDVGAVEIGDRAEHEEPENKQVAQGWARGLSGVRQLHALSLYAAGAPQSLRDRPTSDVDPGKLERRYQLVMEPSGRK